MKRTTVIGILGIGLVISSALLPGFRYSYWGSPADFMLGAGVIYCLLGFSISQTQEEYARALWGGSIIVSSLILTSVAVLATSVSVIQMLTDNMSFFLGVGTIGTGIVGGVRYQTSKSNLSTIALGAGLFLLSTIIGALTIPSLTFYPILQFLLFAGVVLTALLAYIVIRTGSEANSPVH